MKMGGSRFGARKRSRSNQIEPLRVGYYPACTMEQGPHEVQNEWSAYSCPLCHAIFRLPAGSSGVMVECPSCGEMMGVGVSRPSGTTGMAVRPRQVQGDVHLAGGLPIGRVKEEQSEKADVVVSRSIGQEFRKADLTIDRAENEESLKSQPHAKERTRRRSKRRGRRRPGRLPWRRSRPRA